MISVMCTFKKLVCINIETKDNYDNRPTVATNEQLLTVASNTINCCDVYCYNIIGLFYIIIFETPTNNTASSYSIHHNSL